MDSVDFPLKQGGAANFIALVGPLVAPAEARRSEVNMEEARERKKDIATRAQIKP